MDATTTSTLTSTEAGDPIDARAAEAFEEKLVGILNGASLSLMISIGHRTGLFDALARLEWVGSEELAREAGLDERYVREWLGAVATGGIVRHRAETNDYRLPSEHAAFLTRAARPQNMASAMQWIAVLGSAESGIVDCFRRGGGLPYEAYPRFHEVMAEESDQTVVAGLLEHVLPSVDGIVDRLQEGIDVLDVGCGRALALEEMARAFPASRFTGYDLSEEAIGQAAERIRERGLANVEVAVRDVARLGLTESHDLITAFDVVHDQARPDALLAGVHQALRPGGTLLVQDIQGSGHVHGDMEYPLAPFTYTISCMHCMSVSLGQGGAGLGAAWGRRTAVRMLTEAGFAEPEVKELPHDPQNYYYLCRKS